MKKFKQIKVLLVGIIIFFLMNSVAYTQSWEKTQPDKLYATDKNHHVNNVKVGIGTDTPLFPLEVKGQIFSDSLKVTGSVKSDSLTIIGGAHIFGVLHVGQNSLSFGGGPLSTNDYITTTTGLISLGGDGNFWDIKTGIGTDNPFIFDNTGLLRGLEVNNDINLTSNVLNENHGYRIAGNIVLQTPIKIYLLV